MDVTNPELIRICDIERKKKEIYKMKAVVSCKKNFKFAWGQSTTTNRLCYENGKFGKASPNYIRSYVRGSEC